MSTPGLSHMTPERISVVPTKARRAAWRDFLSTRTTLVGDRRSLDYAALRAAPLGTTGKLRYAIALTGAPS